MIMDNENIISNVARVTRQELMDGYRALLRKYRDLAGATADAGQEKVFDKVNQYKGEADIHQALNSTRLAMQGVLAELDTKLATKFSELKQFDEAIAEQKAKLKECYEIESASGALLALLQAKEDVRRQAENEKIELEQKRKRDEEEYKFNFELQKRKEKEVFEVEKREREAELQMQEEALIEKQKAFAATEEQFAVLQKEVSEFPEKLEEEKKQLETQLNIQNGKDKETTVLLLQKESESQKAISNGRIQSLEAMLDDQKQSIANLQEQLKASQSQVQEVVLKSIEGASGAKTLDVVNKLALEQTRSASGQR